MASNYINWNSPMLYCC